YNPTQKKYEKVYTEEGGQIQWIKVASDAPSKRNFLFLDRLDDSGRQTLSAYACLGNGVQPVLQAQAPQVYAQFDGGAKGLSVLCSDKSMPQDAKDADHVFKWNEAKSLFAETAAAPPAGWTGSSVAGTAVTTASASAAPAASPVPTASASAPPTAVVPTPTVLAAAPAPAPPAPSGEWWGSPLDAPAASAKLDDEMVPAAVKSGQMAALGKNANAFFQKAKGSGLSTSAISQMRAGYYASVASTLSGMGRGKDAAYYLDLALKLDPSNPKALGLKAKLKP
ncbi:MAG TPA: hypothetical protein VFR02_05580, partial [bacterium]|nr:hypothetical protein [bacterium]